MSIFSRIRNLLSPSTGTSLEDLGYPTLEELSSVGLTGEQFMDRYVRVVIPRPWENIQLLADRILAGFYSDYPQLQRKKSP